MANRKLFANVKKCARVPVAIARNEAGGRAYDRTATEQLCQYAVTGTINGTFYTSETDQVNKIKELADKTSGKTLANIAIYAHEIGRMKDVPAYLLALLAARGELSELRRAWPKVITNMKMLLNFVQIVRSGQTGRKSFGTAVKTLIKDWLTSQNWNKLFKSSFGHANPSTADVIKMVHPRAKTSVQNEVFKYLIGKDFDYENLPGSIQTFELFKTSGGGTSIPDVPFQALSNIKMSDKQWKEVAINMPWNVLRMNLNQLTKHNVFADDKITKAVARKLGDEKEVLSNNAFPYQLMTTYQYTEDVPMTVKMAIHQALEHATKNVPSLDTKIAVCIDQSGSMDSPVTGNRPGSTSKTMCTEVAALIAACTLRKNPETIVVGWDTSAREIKSVNPADSVLTNARNMGFSGGGTDSACALKFLNQKGHKANLVVYVSDNQGWYNGQAAYGYGTNMAVEWKAYKRRNPKAKLVCINLQPYGSVQVPDDKDVLNIGGFSDAVFTIIKHFVAHGDIHFAKVVNDYAGED